MTRIVHVYVPIKYICLSVVRGDTLNLAYIVVVLLKTKTGVLWPVNFVLMVWDCCVCRGERRRGLEPTLAEGQHCMFINPYESSMYE